jgi:hypothetical protein
MKVFSPRSYGMKKLSYSFSLAFLSLAVAGESGSAQVLDIGQYKGTVYSQTSASPNVTLRDPDIYYFATQMDADPEKALSYSLFMVFTPSLSETNTEFVMTQYSTYFSRFNGAYYASKTNFDADYPNGIYNYAATYSDPTDNTPKSDNVRVQTPANDLFSTTLPAFSADCWTAMQQVDPAQNFNLSWNSYTPMPGADYAYTFVATYDSQTFDSTFGGFNFNGPSTITSTTIPAGNLDYGRTYIVELFFSNRVTPPTTNTDGSAVSVIVGYDDITDATLTTIAPPLQIAPLDGQCVNLLWPAMATNYVLQVTHQLDGGYGWTNVPAAPVVDGSTNIVTLKAKHAQAFFRLAPVSP